MILTTTCFVHRWSLFFSSLAIRNGSSTRHRLFFPTSVTALSFSGCMQCLAFAEQLTSSALRSGYLGHFCLPGIGTRNWGFSERWAHLSHSSPRQPSFRSCQAVGRIPPAVSQL